MSMNVAVGFSLLAVVCPVQYSPFQTPKLFLSLLTDSYLTRECKVHMIREIGAIVYVLDLVMQGPLLLLSPWDGSVMTVP